MILQQTINWKPFSQKHKDYIKNALHNVMNVAEGAVRSGKTIDHCIIAQMYLDTCRDKIHLASGSTLANAKLNIGDCNGFGLEHLFRGRCRWGKYKDNEALFINSMNGEKIVIFVGGGKADSYKKILGNSYGLWIATEINEHYDEDDPQTSFIKVAFDRQLASVDMMTLWDLNPSNPKHKIYTEYIDKWRDNGLEGGYQYEHFTIADNLSISPERRKQIESKYETGSIWYKRNILGMRVTAEGLIYQRFAENSEDYIWKEETLPDGYTIIGIDYGGNKSGQAFVCTRISYDFKQVIILGSERHTGDIDPDDLERLEIEFIKRMMFKYKCDIDSIYPDNEEVVLIRGLNRAVQENNLNISVRGCSKEKIIDRIDLERLMISFNMLYYVKEECQTFVDAMCSAVWDKDAKDDERLDDFSSDIDTLDAFEYSFTRYMRQLNDAVERKIKED